MGDDDRRNALVLSAIQAFRRTFSEINRRLATSSDGTVSMADLLVLHFIAHRGNVTPGQLVDFTGLTSGSVTGIVDRLEKEGFVDRARSEEDRRVVHIRLRAGARTRIMQMMHRAHDDVGGMFAGWSEERIEALVEMLEGLHLVAHPRSG